jgi:hypothetical protein
VADYLYTIIIIMVISGGVSVHSIYHNGDQRRGHLYRVIIIMEISGGVSVHSKYHNGDQWRSIFSQ